MDPTEELFRAAWEVYKSTPDTQQFEPQVRFNGRVMPLTKAWQHLWNDRDVLPNDLHAEVMTEAKHRKPDFDWTVKLFRYSQAARVLRQFTIDRLMDAQFRYRPHAGFLA